MMLFQILREVKEVIYYCRGKDNVCLLFSLPNQLLLLVIARHCLLGLCIVSAIVARLKKVALKRILLQSYI